MDSKLREGDSLVDIDNSAKKKFKFKSFKKLFVKKKRKEPLPSLVSSGLKQSQSASDVTTPDSMHTDYDSEDDIEDAASVLGSRAVSHDSVFIPEMQEPARPMRVFSQENVSDRIKALQVRLHPNIKIGPPPFGMLSKRTEDPGTSSEDDGLPRSPPEMSLIHESIKTRISEMHRHHSSLSLGGTGSEEEEQVASETSSRPLPPEEIQLRDASKSPPERSNQTILSPSADFSTPPQFSTFLDNSAARHRLLIKPRNQRSSKTRRPSVPLLEESVVSTNYMEEEDVTASNRKRRDTSNAEVLTPKDGNVCGNTGKRSTVQNSKKLKACASEIASGSESQSFPEELQNLANETITLTQQSQNIRHASTIDLGDKIKVSDEFVDRLNLKRNENASSNLSIRGKDVSPIIPLPSLEKQLVEDIKIPGDGNEKPFNKPERFSPMLRTISTVNSQESLQSRRGCFRHSLSERSPNTSEQPLSDKENDIKLGSMDTKAERSPTDTSNQRKFSVSSAWERPRTNSFTLKTNTDSDTPKSTKLSLLKPDASKTENIKEEYKSPSIQTENKHAGRKKEILADLEAVPADKAILSTITSKQSAASGDLSVATDPEDVSEDKSPLKLRLPSLSLRYRDGIGPVSVKRHSAEMKLEKTGCSLSSKDETCEVGHTDLAVSRKREMKCKADSFEVVQTKPPLPRKPVLQNITSADNNMNKDVPENGSSQEKTSKFTEEKIEEKLSERRLSVEKNIEKPPSSVEPADPGKGVESKEQQPSWMSIARQKQLSFKEEHPTHKQKTINQETERPNERTEAHLKQQADQIQSKNTLDAIVPETYGQEPNTDIREPRQRANTFPHPVHGTSLSLLTEREEKTLHKRPTLSFSEEPSWMELAKKKSQAWNDMPQIIK